MPYGYLGVDIFFVVGGYLFIKQLSRQTEEKRFNYWNFIFRKIVRLWPLVILAIIVAVAIGYGLMLPDDYENLAESAIASSVFANNILQCITTKNYWDVVNMYKPLMHLWYVGVLMQAFVILTLVYLLFGKIVKKNSVKICTIGLTVISLILFLLPSFSTAWKFYYLPFRIFELTAGGLLVFARPIENEKVKKVSKIVSGAILAFMLCSRWEMVSGSVMLLLTVAVTVVFIYSTLDTTNNGRIVRGIAEIGKRSYSIYIWHQVIIAFLFYSFFPYANFQSFIVFLIATVLISALSYQFIEVPLGKTIGSKKKEASVIIGGIVVSGILCVASFSIYMHAGVVRDVPELGITKNNVHRNMHAEYCDRPYSWDQDFTGDDRVKILVFGNSFGRDWANILFEYDDGLDISYKYYTESAIEEVTDRIGEADFVFYAVSGSNDVPEVILQNVPEDKLYIIGNKNYGESNGIIYAHRNEDDYFEQEVQISDSMLEQEERLADRFLGHYISMIAPVRDGNMIKVFTDDNMFISQDCRHLTQAGAQYYSRILDIKELLGE